MSRKLSVAAIQMDAAPAPTSERLNRASKLVKAAVKGGAQLIVLPELFNTGYQYTDENYEKTESMMGETVTWMKQQAADHHIYLSGTLLLLDQDHVYNSALLFAPDGQMWRYDKHHPFLWERAYFRAGDRITVAETELGKIGMMICWDAAHPDLWARYAGNVDAMIVMSCPPNINKAKLSFPDGTEVDGQDLGFLMRSMMKDEGHFANQDMDDHAAWLQTPVIHTSGHGQFQSVMPASMISVAGYLAARPALWEKVQQADEVRLVCDFDKHTKIIDASGQVQARVIDDGDGFIIAEIELTDEPPQPITDQPAMRTPAPAYFFSDIFGQMVMSFIYRRGLRRRWGARMAPVEQQTKTWTAAILLAVVLGWLLGRFTGTSSAPTRNSGDKDT